VRANLTDARGRAETFRRLRARIAGPDGFTQEIELEAVGSGAYSATLPLSRPGAYIVSVLDEKTVPLGIAGAALGAGEELRPTGTDRALLARIAELSGGRVRDTLAGIFHDRPPRRFAYSSLSSLLVLLAAGGLVAMVAARRLAFPESISALPAKASARLSSLRPSRPGPARAAGRATHEATSAAPPSPPLHEPNASTDGPPSTPAPGGAPASTLATLRERARARTAEAQRRTSNPPLPLPPPPAGRPATAPSTPPFAPPGAPAPDGPRAAPHDSPPGERKRTAAEILLERRKGRKT